jgi:LmbE family N-acetylglucosaminyl deacetylase
LQTAKHKPAVVWEPGDGRILVCAPHMDDEIIGCGGAMHLHVRQGAQVTVVFMTDGAFVSDMAQGTNGHERAVTRKEEACRALEIIGVSHTIFLDAEETGLRSTTAIQEQLRHVLESCRPDLVYLPFFLEEHPEHQITNQILLEATEGAAFRFDCYAYEVWTPLLPNCLVDITEVVETKKQALCQYQTQLADKNYVHTSLGLNAFRSCGLLDRDDRFTEAFFVASLADYRQLYQSFHPAS